MSLNIANYSLSKKEWDKAYEDLQILRSGRRNLLKNSGNFENNVGWSRGAIVSKSGYKAIEVYSGTLGGRDNSVILETNTHYVYSGWLMSSEDYDPKHITHSVPLHCQVRYNEKNSGGLKNSRIVYKPNEVIPSETWFKIVVAFESIEENPDGNITFIPFVYSTREGFTGVKYWMRDFKLEKGEEASPWTPAPEDIDAHPLVVQMAEAAYKNSEDNKTISELEDALTILGGN